MPRKKKTKEAKPDATPETTVAVTAPEEGSNLPATSVNGVAPETTVNPTAPETAGNRVAAETNANPETNANKRPEQPGRSNNRSRNKNRNKNKKEAKPDAAPETIAPVSVPPVVAPREESAAPEPAVNSVAAETAINIAAPETAGNRVAPETNATPETNANRRPEHSDRSNNRSRNKNRNKNKKETKPELAEEIVNFIEEEEGIENPDLLTVNMICTNVALLQTILDVQVKILAKLNNQELSQVNAQVDTLYKKYRKKALTDLIKFDKDA